jgi:hypothetical protein
MTHTPITNHAQAAFDSAMRTHYAQAQAQVSPQVRAQLAQRRSAVLRGSTATSRAPRFHLRFAAASFAAVCVLAAGLHFMQPTATSELIIDEDLIQQTALLDSTGNVSLEEDPDFYAWLGTADVQYLALE